MKRTGHVVYLHGFASSPDSSKALRFQAELGRRGVGFSCPNLNEPDFTSLTITRMLADARGAIEAAGGGPVTIVGSSLGAFVAVHAAARDASQRVDRLILLAPALDFGGNRLREFGDHGVDEWRRKGTLRVKHHALGEDRDIGFGLYEDAAGYDAFEVTCDVPVLAFQGRADTVVDPAMVADWALGRSNVDLRFVEDDHQLGASVDDIWRESARFLGLDADSS